MKSLSKNLVLFILSFILAVIIFEIYSRFTISKTAIKKIDLQDVWDTYSAEELDSNFPSYTIDTGLNCMENIKPTWHNKFGYIDKKIQYSCLQEHFQNNTINIAFFGGSLIESTTFKNYLTAIDYQVVSLIKNSKSINFGLSGSRLSNEYARFSIMLQYIKPKIAIFLDGGNEFNSIKYKEGNFDEDFYWTVWIKKRIEDPYKIYLDKIVEKSYFFRTILINIFGFQASNIVNTEISDEKIIQSASEYIHYKNLIKSICEHYDIKCFFFLSPTLYHIETDDKLINKLKQNNLSQYPLNKKIHTVGYEYILKDEDIISLIGLFKNEKNVMVDDQHISKRGSKIISNKIVVEINKYIKQINTK